MHKTEFVLANETNKILWNFEILTNHLTQGRRLDQIIINKNKKSKLPVLLILAFHRVGNQRK